jgi:hypothetical protein
MPVFHIVCLWLGMTGACILKNGLHLAMANS